MAVRAESTNEPQPKEFVDPLTGKSYHRTNFADEVRGNEAKAIDFTMAKLAQDSYRSHIPDRPPIDGWRALNEAELMKVGIDPKMMTDKKSGFDAAIYTDGDGRYALAFRGTDQGKDWKSNLGQGLGFETAQYNLGLQLGMQAKVAFGDQVIGLGHSLGGGVFAEVSVATGMPGMTYNAAGLSDKTMTRLGLDPEAVKREAEDGQIRNYQVKGEILTHMQEKNLATRWIMPDAIGRDMQLPDPDPLKGIHKINPFEKIPHRVGLHSMETVLQAWEMKHGHLLSENQPAQDKSSLQDRAHPANARFENANGELNAKLQNLGLTNAEARNVSADLALQTLRDGITPKQYEIGKDQQRAFAVPEGDTKPYSQVVIAESRGKSIADISQEADKLVATNPTLVAANPNQGREQTATPAPDQANPDIGGLSVSRGGR